MANIKAYTKNILKATIKVIKSTFIATIKASFIATIKTTIKATIKDIKLKINPTLTRPLVASLLRLTLK